MKLFVSFYFFSIMLDLASLTDARGESVLYRIKSLFINFGGAWSKQELFKGCSLWTGVNTFTFAGAEIEGGWGFHCWATNINNEAIKVRYSAADANALVANGSIVTNAVFDRGVSAMFKPDISDFEKADILAYHIPAVSSPAGKVAVLGGDNSVDMNISCKVNEWGREGVQVEKEGQRVTEYPWLHSDIKNMAYYYVYPAFTNIIEKGVMR